MKRSTTFAALLFLGAFTTLALYDPKPDAALAAVQGEWKGALTYRDYSEPHGLVTLPTRLFVALSAPNELVLNYVFDDGPSKTVFSYEKMNFDFINNLVTWTSGADKKSVSVYNITTNSAAADTRKLTFERKEGDKIDRLTLELSPHELKLSKNEVNTAGEVTFRDKYDFLRPGT
jgi:hypothetical protein